MLVLFVFIVYCCSLSVFRFCFFVCVGCLLLVFGCCCVCAFVFDRASGLFCVSCVFLCVVCALMVFIGRCSRFFVSLVVVVGR